MSDSEKLPTPQASRSAPCSAACRLCHGIGTYMDRGVNPLRCPGSAGFVPESEFNVGDPVMVRCDEYPGMPFPALVSAVWWCSKYNHHEYRVMSEDGCEADGYTAEWLTAQNDQADRAAVGG